MVPGEGGWYRYVKLKWSAIFEGFVFSYKNTVQYWVQTSLCSMFVTEHCDVDNASTSVLSRQGVQSVMLHCSRHPHFLIWNFRYRKKGRHENVSQKLAVSFLVLMLAHGFLQAFLWCNKNTGDLNTSSPLPPKYSIVLSLFCAINRV
jgi:hypothetical protein